MCINIIMVCSLLFVCSLHAQEALQESIPLDVGGEEKITSSFSYLVGSTIEDGFFGGVKWGVAAAFYHLLYKGMGLTLFVVPKLCIAVSTLYARWRDVHLGRPPLLQIHELQVFVALLSEALTHYEELVIVEESLHSCAALSNKTLAAVMKHIHEYISVRSARYTDAVEDGEILFFLTLITDTIESILDCIEYGAYRAEIITTVKTTVIIMNKLIVFLQGPVLDTERYDPGVAWFNNMEGKLYAFWR